MLTIGHSTRTWQEFIDLLNKNKVTILVDVRRFPGSRRYPHFNRGSMRDKLKEHAIEYVHLETLGGRRRPLKDDRNSGWRNKSFKGYADYMSCTEFKNGIMHLLKLNQNGTVAIMCAEAVPWNCHRTLISDFLFCICEIPVVHILSAGKVQPHSVTDFARVTDGGKLLLYPPDKSRTILQ